MRRLLAALALSLLATPFAAPVTLAADARGYDCPQMARGTVSYVGMPGWYATGQSSEVQSAHIGVVGGSVKLICVYHMFGGDYWIHRDLESGYGDCSVMRNANAYSFYCRRG